MRVRASDLKAIGDQLREMPTETGERATGKRARGSVSRAIEELLPVIEARRAAGAPQDEIIDFLIEHGVVSSKDAYYKALKIARRNFRERVGRNTPVLASDGGWNRTARASGAAEPAQAPTTPVKPGLEDLSPDQIQELALKHLDQQRFHDEIEAALKDGGVPMIANLKGDGVLRHIGPRPALPPTPIAAISLATTSTKDLIAQARAEADARMAKPKPLPAGMQVIVDRQYRREQAEREEAHNSERKPEEKS